MAAGVDHELWQLAVFCAAGAVGNPTGVVFPGPGLGPEDYLRLAAWLGYPDTVFLRPGPDLSHWRAHSFSPAGELSFCIQTLLAADAVIRRKWPRLIKETLSLTTPSRLATVERLPGTMPALGWVKISQAEIRVRPGGPPLHSIFRMDLKGEFPELIIDSGRSRVYRRLPHLSDLEEVWLPPDQVLAYCQDSQVHGICLFSLMGHRTMATRVFTTSLDGREDVATGGAVLGLLAYLARQDPGITRGGDFWTIHQGQGPPHRRGTLFIKELPEEQAVAVGGLTRVVAQGVLVKVEDLLEKGRR
jgi:predicted PhzF superfamily epimerase YddE/YHI9